MSDKKSLCLHQTQPKWQDYVHFCGWPVLQRKWGPASLAFLVSLHLEHLKALRFAYLHGEHTILKYKCSGKQWSNTKKGKGHVSWGQPDLLKYLLGRCPLCPVNCHVPKAACISCARSVSNSSVKLCSFFCLFELLPLQRRKYFPGLWSSPCWQKGAKGKDYAAFCKTKRDVTFIYLLTEMKKYSDLQRWKIHKKEKRCIVLLFNSDFLKNPFRLDDTRKMTGKMDTWKNQIRQLKRNLNRL